MAPQQGSKSCWAVMSPKCCREVQDLHVMLRSAGEEGRSGPRRWASALRSAAGAWPAGQAAVSQDKVAALAQRSVVSVGRLCLASCVAPPLHSTVGLSFKPSATGALLVILDDKYLCLASGTVCLLLGGPACFIQQRCTSLRQCALCLAVQ